MIIIKSVLSRKNILIPFLLRITMLDVDNRLGNIRCDNDVYKCPSVFLEEALSENRKKCFYTVTQYRGKKK